MDLDERKDLIYEIRPELSKIDSIHESQWILDYVRDLKLPTPEARRQKVFDIVERRKKNEPLAYILGKWSFRSAEFYVGRGVLIPRPESEELVEATLKTLQNSNSTVDRMLQRGIRVLDIGAGSGCVGLSFMADLIRDLKIEEKQKYVHGVELLTRNFELVLVENSTEALPYLKKNVELFRERLMHTKVGILDKSFEELEDGQFDIILSNPPYVTQNEYDKFTEKSVRDFEPRQALLPTDLQEFPDATGPYRKIFTLAQKALRPDGWIYLEIGPAQVDWIKPYAATLGFLNDTRTLEDMSGKIRMFGARRNS